MDTQLKFGSVTPFFIVTTPDIDYTPFIYLTDPAVIGLLVFD